MVQLIFKSFMNKLYAAFSIVISISEAILLFIIMTFMTDFQDLAVKIFFSCVCGTIVFLPFYISAPLAFRRIQFTNMGIVFGKQCVKYEDIERISITRARVSHWFGYAFIEDLLGLPQHFDAYYGEVICINCEFSNYKFSKSQSKLYLPRNEKVEAIFQEYCPKYNIALETYNSIKRDRLKMGKYELVLCVLSSIFSSILVAFILSFPLLMYKKIIVAIALFAALFIIIWRHGWIYLYERIKSKTKQYSTQKK